MPIDLKLKSSMGNSEIPQIKVVTYLATQVKVSAIALGN